MAMATTKEASPHVLMLPFPAQGHINPFMELAQLLSQNNVMVSFVNTEISHELLPHLKSTELIRFLSIPDGLPKDHGRHHDLIEFGKALATNVPPQIEKIIDCAIAGDDRVPPISVIISDGMISFIHKVADKYNIPRISFSTSSACGVAVFNSLPILRKHGVIPAPVDEDLNNKWMNKRVECVPAMEALRGKDLPSFFRSTDPSDFMLNWIKRELVNADSADLIILNTWEDAEGPVLEQLNKDYNGKVLSVGPLMMFAENMSIKASLWEEENSCLVWLEKQIPRSVIYVGFGSVAILNEQQFAEFATGLENCGQPFVWVITYKAGSLQGKLFICVGRFRREVQGQSCFVNWAPQRKVLGHPSVAAFLTHCGWNSTMECLCSGVPMLCWPYFSDQQTNSRFLTAVGKTGLELSEEIRGEEIVEGVRKIMHCHGEENHSESDNVAVNARKYRERALLSTGEGGRSRANVLQLVDRIRAASAARPN